MLISRFSSGRAGIGFALSLIALVAGATIQAEEPDPVLYQKKMQAYFDKWRAETQKSKGMEYRFRLTERDSTIPEKKEYHGEAITLTAGDAAKDWNRAEIQIKSVDTKPQVLRKYIYTQEETCLLDFQEKSMAVLPLNYKSPLISGPIKASDFFGSIKKNIFLSETEIYRKLLSLQVPDFLSPSCHLEKEDEWYLYLGFYHFPGLSLERGRIVLNKQTGLPRQLYIASNASEYILDIESMKSRADLRDSHFSMVPKMVPENWIDRFRIDLEGTISIAPWVDSPQHEASDSGLNPPLVASTAKRWYPFCSSK